jgi:argininosuccinate synthase
MTRIVLAYSGSRNTTAAISWLAETFGAEVVTVTLDLGQGTGLEAVRDAALAAGARRAHVIDARAEFADDFIVPALSAGAIAAGDDPLVTALGRPLVARHLVDIARLEETHVVAHGGDRRSADGQRLDTLIHALDASLVVLAPVGDPGWAEDAAARFSERGMSSLGAPEVDVNLWGRTVDTSRPSGVRSGPEPRPYVLTRSAPATPDTPADVEISFEEGVPVAVNGVPLSLVELISSLETIAGAHGVGRLEAPESRALPGRRITVEAPAAVVLRDAHRALQAHVTPAEIVRAAAERGGDYAHLVLSGAWFTPAREMVDTFTAAVSKHMTGTTRLRLFKGRSEVVECRSPFALSLLEPARAAGAVAGRSS